MKKIYTIAFFMIATLFHTTGLRATSMLPLSLEHLSVQASYIFHGKVIANETVRDEQSNHMVTLTTFSVLQVVKGQPGETYTIKQLGGIDPDTGLRMRIHGVPEFSLQQEYMVFLPERSSLGFSSPLGLNQGTFSVQQHAGINMVIGTQRFNPGTSHTLPSPQRSVMLPLAIETDDASHHTGLSTLADFVGTVEAYNVE